MFVHIITTNDPTQWEVTRKEAEERMHQDLSAFKPYFVQWKDIKLNTSDPVDQVTNTALWQQMRSILIKGRAKYLILVIQATLEDLDDITNSNNSNDRCNESFRMKNEIISNSMILVSQLGGSH